MYIWIALVVVLGAALLLELVFELRNIARRQNGLVLDFYQETIVSHQGALSGSAGGCWRWPAGFFGLLAALIGALLTLATFALGLARSADPTDVTWFIVGLGALGVLYFLTGLWASSAAGTVRAGLISGTALACATAAIIVLATGLDKVTWSVGPWSSAAPSLIGYLAYFGVLLLVFGLPGLALCAGGALLGRSRHRRQSTTAAQAHGRRRRRQKR
jgi:hypothetical protein